MKTGQYRPFHTVFRLESIQTSRVLESIQAECRAQGERHPGGASREAGLLAAQEATVSRRGTTTSGAFSLFSPVRCYLSLPSHVLSI
jgi:hypothetical protein